MKLLLVLSILYALLIRRSSPLKTTLPAQQRIDKLKSQLRAEIQRGYKKLPNSAEYSYEEYDKNWVMHPIDPKQSHPKYRPLRLIRTDNEDQPRTDAPTSLKPIKSKKVRVTTKAHTHKSRNQLRAELKALKTSKSAIYMLNPLDIFYRRGYQVFTNESNIKWVQCQDLITPYLTGIKKEPTVPRKIGAHDLIPKRLFEMLQLDTNTLTKDDIYTVIYQISKLQIRLFQWDIMPIRILINIFTKGRLHTFRNVKRGIKDLFSRWRLSFDNMTYILQNTNIIRPPCIETSRYSGSTKSNKVSKFKDWTSKATTKCEVDDWTCDERKKRK